MLYYKQWMQNKIRKSLEEKDFTNKKYFLFNIYKEGMDYTDRQDVVILQEGLR